MHKINLMSLRHSAFYAPYLMTMAGGYLAKAGLDATYTIQTPDNLVKDRLLDGRCHVSQSAVAAGFISLENNQPDNIRHFAQINSRDGFFIAGRSPEHNFSGPNFSVPNFSWSTLTGKSVLVDHFFQPMAMLKFAFHKQGISFSDINVIDAGDVSEIDAAFRSGTGDYVHQQGPAPQQLEADGIASVVASVGEIVGPVAFSSLCATQQWLQTDMASSFIAAYQKSLQACNENSSEDIARQLQDYGFLKEIDFNVLNNTINTYQKMGCWNHNGSIGHEEYETLLDVFEFSELITHRHAYESLIYRK